MCIRDRVYTVRYGMEMLMRYYLDDAFRPEYLEWVADVRSTEYYICLLYTSFSSSFCRRSRI